LALAAAADFDTDAGRTVGGVYAANTLGAILGALSVSLILVPAIGTQNTQRLLLILAAAGAMAALGPFVKKGSTSVSALLAATTMLATTLAWNLDAVPGELIAYGRRMPLNTGESQILYTVEGINSSVAISRWSNGEVYINVNGHV